MAWYWVMALKLKNRQFFFILFWAWPLSIICFLFSLSCKGSRAVLVVLVSFKTQRDCGLPLRPLTRKMQFSLHWLFVFGIDFKSHRDEILAENKINKGLKSRRDDIYIKIRLVKYTTWRKQGFMMNYELQRVDTKATKFNRYELLGASPTNLNELRHSENYE